MNPKIINAPTPSLKKLINTPIMYMLPTTTKKTKSGMEMRLYNAIATRKKKEYTITITMEVILEIRCRFFNHLGFSM